MKMRNRISIIVAFILLASVSESCKKPEIGPAGDCICRYTDSSSVHPKAAAYQAVIDKYTKLGLPGISLLVRDSNGTWSGASGMADIENRIEFKSCHISKVASITKLFIGVLIMKLQEEGVFDLDDPISKYLSAEEIKDIANAGDVSIRQLMNHTSGIYDVITDSGFYLELLNNPQKHWSHEDLLKYVRKKDAYFPAGTGVKYSNTNLLLAIMVIEEATGRPHNELLREKIIQPLGLYDTYYFYHEQLPDFVAQGYFDLYNNGTILNMTSYNTGAGNGYGGIYSTVYDLQIFADALFRDKTLLSPASLTEMTQFTAIDVENNRSFGIGMMNDFLERDPIEHGYGHRGRDLAYSADLYYFPEKGYTMAYLVNYGTNGSSSLKQIFFDFRKEIVDVIMQ